jgi:hypothetical protein
MISAGLANVRHGFIGAGVELLCGGNALPDSTQFGDILGKN